MSSLPQSPTEVKSSQLPPYFRNWLKWFDALRLQYGAFTEANKAGAFREIEDYLEAKDCDHLPEIVYVTASNGTRMYTQQCRHCWKRMGQWISQTKLTQDEIDRAHEAANSHDLWVALEGPKLHMFNVVRLSVQTTPKDDYAEYLRSPEWRRKRQLVLDRDNHTCQGCLEEEATEVHHLTYDHVYDEFMFELISLCGSCHARFHGVEVGA